MPTEVVYWRSEPYSSPDTGVIHTPFGNLPHDVDAQCRTQDVSRKAPMPHSYPPPGPSTLDTRETLSRHASIHSPSASSSPESSDFSPTGSTHGFNLSPFYESSPELDPSPISCPPPSPTDLYPFNNAQSNQSSPQSFPSFSSVMSYNLDAHFHCTRFLPTHKLNRHFVQSYQLEDELGSGGYGFVMTARHRVEGCEVAVKFIIKDKVPEHSWMEDKTYGQLPSEVVLLSLIDHPGVAKCLDLYEDTRYFYLVQELHGSPWPKAMRKKPLRISTSSDDSASETSTPSLSPSVSMDSLSISSEPATPPTISVELADPDIVSSALQPKEEVQKPLETLKPNKPQYLRRPSHDLFECIEQSKNKRLSEDKARYVFAQIVDVVYYLDTNGIAHRDIKDENIVIDKNYRVKLIDFGSATIVDPQEPRPFSTLFYGTAAYASSEILRKKPYQAAPAEVWTIGVLLSYLLTGMSPFPSMKEAIDGRIVLPDSPRVPRSALNLMRMCLDPNPKTRATISDVKKHPWLASRW